jgi:hypothetical protein
MFKRPTRTTFSRGIAIIVFCLGLGVASPAYTHPFMQKGAEMPSHATGTFEVKLTPQNDSADAIPGRMTIEKQIHGDVEGTSKGQMLTAGTEVKGSAGYVAIEKVTGTLKGRTGTFIMQHTGTMNRGQLHLSITVVPDSGTGQLAGLAGTFNITIADGKHSYDFEYTLPESH